MSELQCQVVALFSIILSFNSSYCHCRHFRLAPLVMFRAECQSQIPDFGHAIYDLVTVYIVDWFSS